MIDYIDETVKLGSITKKKKKKKKQWLRPKKFNFKDTLPNILVSFLHNFRKPKYYLQQKKKRKLRNQDSVMISQEQTAYRWLRASKT